ncbi:MAG: U32 family peptidase [Oscillospiraceae bacterium]|nr:U32 family peptidase [Oscillospiraceae bacterium]
MELLAPAGNLLKLKTAYQYGADACYMGLDAFSLRRGDRGFGYEQLEKALTIAKNSGKKLYLTANIFARNSDLPSLGEFFRWANSKTPDGMIISDLGVMALAQKHAPNVPIHISTQSNILNAEAAKTWEKLGASRLILARELHISDVSEIAANTCCEIEVFVHGAMCMAYSGRCFLSSYMTGRDANRGDCAQPCRWNYALVEEKRDGEYFPIAQDESGVYLFNSKDLCLINRLEELEKAGIHSLKIEGRMKSEYYVAATTKAYRRALDGKENTGEHEKISHREYSEGFMFGAGDLEIPHSAGYVRTARLLAAVLDSDGEFIKCEQRNKFHWGDCLEILTPGENHLIEHCEIYDENRQVLDSVPHPRQFFYLRSDLNLPGNCFVRSN